MMSIKRFRLEPSLIFFVALLTLIANGSWLQFQKNSVVKILLILAVAALLVHQSSKKKLSSPNIFIFFLVAFPIVSTYVINLSSKVNLINIIFTSVLMVLLSFFKKELLYKIFDRYCKLIFFLLCCAIPLGTLAIVYFDFFERTPKVFSPFFESSGGYWYNLIVFTERSIQDFRVQSIFWEPGAWAYNQMIAFYYLIFVKKEFDKIPFFIVSLILTLSTSGLVACLLLLLLLIRQFNLKSIIIGISFLLTIVAIVSYVVLSDEIISESFYQNTIGKFSNNSVSFEDRSVSTAVAFKIANENWLFGIGRLDNEETVYVTSCFSEISYQLGYLYTVIYFIIFCQFFKRLGIICTVIFCVILLNSEAYSFFSLNMLLIVLGSKVFFNKKTDYEISYLITT